MISGHIVGIYPGLEPRLVVGQSATRPLTLAEERAAGTYSRVDTAQVIDEIDRAGLRGKGGAGFPAAIKWRTVAAAEHCVVVANGEEGEPASFKDRWLLTHRPHAVLDGLLLAADTLGAGRVVAYLSHGETVSAVRGALAELPNETADRVEVHVVEHSYVAGEESSVVRSINGGPAMPTAKPPRVFESGVDGVPTLVTNVETLVQAAWVARHGAEAYRAYGTDSSPGTTLVTFTGDCTEPGVFEVPYGPTLRDLFLACASSDPGSAPGLLMGGWFAGIAEPRDVLDRPWCDTAMTQAGSALGCGSVTVLAADEPVAAAAARLAAWYAQASSQQCGVCREGTKAIAAAFAKVRDNAAGDVDLINLARWGTSLRGKGACSFLDGAANIARTGVHLHKSTTRVLTTSS